MALPTVSAALTHFIDRAVQKYGMFYDVLDKNWRSPCEQGQPTTHENLEIVPWLPLKRSGSSVFGGLEDEVHPDVANYFEAYYSGGLEADSPEGPVSLIMLWNDADRERLMENVVGHFLAQKVARAPRSCFFACTDPRSEFFLTVATESGEIMLEKPGYKPIRKVADCLSQFLDSLTPASPGRHPERAELVSLWLDS